MAKNAKGAEVVAETSDEAAPRPPGRRERSKQDKLNRIIRAGRALFREKGFEATTIHAIAEAADIGAGTVFLYASSKEDVLVLVLVDDMIRALERVPLEQPASVATLDQLVVVFDALLRFHAKYFDLSRHLVRELSVLRNPKRQPDVLRLHAAIHRRVDPIVRRAQASGELRGDIEPEHIAWQFFNLYYGVLASWLNGVVSLSDCRRYLADSFRCHLEGVALRLPAR
jgi:AcrR family transcriptional regulator